MELRAPGDARRQRSPDAREKVCGHRADDVVDLQAFQQSHAGHDERAANGADDNGPIVVDEVGRGSDGDEAPYGAVQDGEEVGASEHGLRHQKRDHDARRRRQVGVHQHNAHPDDVDDAAEGELRPAVEAQPAEPEDEDAKGNGEDVGGRRRPYAAVASELAEARANDDETGERCPAAGAVDDGGAGKVDEAEIAQPAAAPGPGTNERVAASLTVTPTPP